MSVLTRITYKKCSLLSCYIVLLLFIMEQIKQLVHRHRDLEMNESDDFAHTPRRKTPT